MQLTVLGSGTFIPTAERNTSGYLLDIGNETILLDSGSGSIRQLFKAGRSFLEIRRVFYSHFHLDHIADFLPLLFSRKYVKPLRPSAPLTVYAHPNFCHYYAALTTLFEKWVIDPEHPSEFQPINTGEYEFPGYRVRIFPSNHTPESLMYRFEEQNRSFLYTGDVDLDENLFEAAHQVDWLLIECGNPDSNAAPGHMNPAKIKQLIAVAEPKQVILTHIPPELEDLDIRQTFGGQHRNRIKMARDLQKFNLS